jgi:hypothetical protein
LLDLRQPTTRQLSERPADRSRCTCRPR